MSIVITDKITPFGLIYFLICPVQRRWWNFVRFLWGLLQSFKCQKYHFEHLSFWPEIFPMYHKFFFEKPFLFVFVCVFVWHAFIGWQIYILPSYNMRHQVLILTIDVGDLFICLWFANILASPGLSQIFGPQVPKTRTRRATKASLKIFMGFLE